MSTTSETQSMSKNICKILRVNWEQDSKSLSSSYGCYLLTQNESFWKTLDNVLNVSSNFYTIEEGHALKKGEIANDFNHDLVFSYFGFDVN